jgi:phospholipase C
MSLPNRTEPARRRKPPHPQPAGPIQHVVIIFKENHTFDNYFGRYPGVEGDANLAAAPNPPPPDPSHTHEAWLQRATSAVRQQYDQSAIPAYWEYARQFCLCDHFFSDVAGPSTPNHLMVIAAASPIINNPHSNDPKKLRPPYNLPSLPALLQKAGYTWGNYGGYAFEYIQALRNSPSSHTSQRFAMDAAAGKLPAVSWVYAPEIAHNLDPLSEHPTGNVTDGMNWTVQQVNAIVKGGLWPSTAIFITWDDWGGWYDHLDPPELEQWSDGTQFRLGNRVGCLALSPYTRQGYVSKTQKSFVSLVKFCETIFKLPNLNQRDAAADDMMDCFNFQQTPLPPPSAG